MQITTRDSQLPTQVHNQATGNFVFRIFARWQLQEKRSETIQHYTDLWTRFEFVPFHFYRDENVNKLAKKADNTRCAYQHVVNCARKAFCEIAQCGSNHYQERAHVTQSTQTQQITQWPTKPGSLNITCSGNVATRAPSRFVWSIMNDWLFVQQKYEKTGEQPPFVGDSMTATVQCTQCEQHWTDKPSRAVAYLCRRSQTARIAPDRTTSSESATSLHAPRHCQCQNIRDAHYCVTCFGTNFDGSSLTCCKQTNSVRSRENIFRSLPIISWIARKRPLRPIKFKTSIHKYRQRVIARSHQLVRHSLAPLRLPAKVKTFINTSSSDRQSNLLQRLLLSNNSKFKRKKINKFEQFAKHESMLLTEP